MPTAVPAVTEVVPGTVAYELLQIRKVAKGGKTLPREQFAEQIGISASQLMGAEKGRKIKDTVWEKIVAAYPQLERFVGNDPTTSGDTSAAVQDVPLPSDTMEPSSDEQAVVPEAIDNTINVIEPFEYIDDPHPLPGDNLSEVVVLDVRPPTQKEEQENYTHDEAGLVDGHSESQQNTAVVGSSARYEQGHNEERAIHQDSRLFSNSEIQAFKRCRRKWYLAWYRKLLLNKKEIIGPRSTGTRIHYALEQWYVPEGQEPKDPKTALEEIIAEDKQVLINQYGQTADDVPEDIKKQFVNSSDLERAMIEGYMQWIADEGIDQGLNVIAPEQYVEVNLGVDGAPKPVKLIGKLDVRVQRETDGAQLFIDHKTKQSLDTSTLHMDEQMLHYHLLEWMNSPDINKKIDGALYNMLRKVKRTGNAKPPFYAREEKSFNFVELKNYQSQVIGVIKDILRVTARLEMNNSPMQQIIYPNKQSDCSWSCDFFPVCPMFDDGSRAEDMVEEYYRVGDPLEYYDDKHLKAS